MTSQGDPATGGRDRWLLVAAAGLAVLMASMDMSIVNTALPALETHFDTSTNLTKWAVLGYLTPVVALALPSGRWVDGVGWRKALVLSVSVFALASVAAGLAPGFAWLVAARLVQGAFAAVLFALIPVLAFTAVREQARGRALGVVTTLGPMGLVLGPPLGGLLLDTLGWPWIFYSNVPVAALVLALGASQLGPGRPLRLPDRSWTVETVLLGSAVAALMVGLSLAADGALAWLVLLAAAVPPVLLWRRMATSAPVRDLFRTRGTVGPHVALAAVSTAVGLLFFVMPFFLMRVLEARPSAAGVTLLALPLAMGVLGPVGGALADWWGARRAALAGAVALTASLLLLVPLPLTGSLGDVAVRLGLVGLGIGLFNAPNMTIAMSNAPGPLMATTGASTNLARQLGFALGPALATMVWGSFGYTLTGMRWGIVLIALLGLVAIVAAARTPHRAPAGPR